MRKEERGGEEREKEEGGVGEEACEGEGEEITNLISIDDIREFFTEIIRISASDVFI